jgi:hypothetical protein
MTPSRIRWIVLVAVLAGCRETPPKTATMSEALPNLPLPPGASYVSRSAGPDALQVTLRSPVAVDVVVAYYRKALSEGRWKLVNEARDADSAVVLFAQQDGPPLWVRIRKDAEGNGTLVDLSGAVMPKSDSAAGPAAKPAS